MSGCPVLYFFLDVGMCEISHISQDKAQGAEPSSQSPTEKRKGEGILVASAAGKIWKVPRKAKHQLEFSTSFPDKETSKYSFR